MRRFAAISESGAARLRQTGCALLLPAALASVIVSHGSGVQADKPATVTLKEAQASANEHSRRRREIMRDSSDDGYEQPDVEFSRLDGAACGGDEGVSIKLSDRLFYEAPHLAENNLSESYTPRLPGGQAVVAKLERRVVRERKYRFVPVFVEIDVCGSFETQRVLSAVWHINHSSEDGVIQSSGDIIENGGSVTFTYDSSPYIASAVYVSIVLPDEAHSILRNGDIEEELTLTGLKLSFDWSLERSDLTTQGDLGCEDDSLRRVVMPAHLFRYENPKYAGVPESARILENGKQVRRPVSFGAHFDGKSSAELSVYLCSKVVGVAADRFEWTATNLPPHLNPIENAAVDAPEPREGIKIDLIFRRINEHNVRLLNVNGHSSEVGSKEDGNPYFLTLRNYRFKAIEIWPIEAILRDCPEQHPCTVRLGETQ